MRASRALWRMPTALTLAMSVIGLALAARKVTPEVISESLAWAVCAGSVASVVLTGLVAWFRHLPPHAAALALDRHHELAGRLSNAVAFEASDESFDGLAGQWRRLAVKDAYRVIADLEPRKAVPMCWPPELTVSLAVGIAVIGLSMLEVSVEEPLRAGVHLAKYETDPLELSDDDLDALRSSMDELVATDPSPEVKQAVQRFNQLVEDLAQRRLDRSEAFRRMSQIEDELLRGARADKQATDEALRDTAKELDKSDLSRSVAESLKKGDLNEAEKRMKKLAERLRATGAGKPNQKQIDRLRKALARASTQRKEALSQLEEKRAELQRQLLKKKREIAAKKTQDEGERRLLKKKRRRLKRLERQRQRQQRASRRLSRLDRQLAKAAADLMRQLGASADDLERAAEDINRLNKQQMSDEDKERLRKRLEQLRQMIRQQGKGGERRLRRLKRFGKRARGGKSRPGGTRPGQGRGKGSGQGTQPGGVVFGPGGQPIPVPVAGGSSPGGDGKSPGGGGEKGGGKSWGKGAGGDPKGKHTDIKGQHVDVRAEAVDTQQGKSNAEVIHSAAQRGFSSQPYSKVYRKYQTVAEGQIDKEEIPDGMRFYVRRYFQLIRPRE